MDKTYVAVGGKNLNLSNIELEEHIKDALSRALSDINNSGNIIIIPPDITRIHSGAGFLTKIAEDKLGNKLGAILPALGTHKPMNNIELEQMFGLIPKDKFLVHNWRCDTIELGRLESAFTEKKFSGIVNYDFPAEVNKHLCKNNSFNLTLAVSIGQVVPHEVTGMANHTKNIFIGTGGKEAVDKSHFAGAVYGMERIMGKTDTPVRALLDECFNRFRNYIIPVLWVLTVIGEQKDGSLAVRGLYIGFGRECYEKAAELSKKVNVNPLKKKVNKVIVYLEPDHYKSTWLGNKAIYRTRMAIKDGGELIIIAPGLDRFGEDKDIDLLIKKYGYRTSPEILNLVKTEKELIGNLSCAAHLIHGSSEGRFTVRYCPGKGLTRREIESAGFKWGDLNEAQKKYDIKSLKTGINNIMGEDVLYIQNPALGLWS